MIIFTVIEALSGEWVTGAAAIRPPLLDAQRTLADVDSAVAESHGALATDQVAVFLALGGGWV